MTDGWTRNQRRELRDLQGIAWERELTGALEELQKDFQSWNNGDISPFELNDRIHCFHNGPSRQLFNTYSGSLDTLWLDQVITRGVIEESEVSEGLLAIFRAGIERYRERTATSEDSAYRDK